MWTTDPTCKEVIKAAMQIKFDGSSSYAFCRNLTLCRRELLKWNQKEFGYLQTQMKEINNQLKQLQEHNAMCIMPTESSIQKEQELLIQYDHLLQLQEMHWHQKSRQDWWKLGEMNTKYFHTLVIKRRHRANISQIKDSNGTTHQQREDIGNCFVNYFSDLFSSTVDDLPGSYFDVIPQLVSDEDNECLLRPVQDSEVFEALNHMGSLKAPGPDGFQALFFKNYWNEVGPKVLDLVQNLFNNGAFSKEINHTHIVLIPKTNNPISPDHFRPISLTNVVYKLISKILVNRMRPILLKIISPHQSAFLPNRSLHDNALLTHEAFHTIRSKYNLKQNYFALKLDLQKAYDKLEWGFLQKVLRAFGFDETFVRKIMFCVKSISYSVLLNGSPFGYFCPTRGIRQGDPMSPYLFIICAEVLSLKLLELQSNSDYDGIKLARNCQPLTHLMYADDIIIYGKTDLKQAVDINKVLEEYCAVAGNTAMHSKLYSDAIELYSYAITLCESDSVYYRNRSMLD
ncbi:hypothetical protein IFM89_023604 [Coptis chinensis]|uniref:Reverse transcriptase domain-containing protein n=1 Tax=Coptis chinensis TaxID=261450 RepID=A0A835H866_9MAGN|nr:hypothetical protein IFM89_023604 [Coptis chinensis]